VFLLLWIICLSVAFAADHSFEMRCLQLKKKMPQIKIEEIKKGPLGLCEIWSGDNVIYFSPDKNLLF